MSPITTKFRLALVAAATFAASTTAEAKPRRIVVLDFEGGSAKQQKESRKAVLDTLGEDYELVSPKRWNAARDDAESHGHGPAVWFEASRKALVDAVIEGAFDAKTKQITLTVHDASTGNELDSFSVKPSDKKQLESDLSGALESIDSTASDSADSKIPVAKVDKVMLGAKKPAAAKKPVAEDEDAPVAKADTADKADETVAKPKTVATEGTLEEAGKPKSDLIEIFGPDSKELQVTEKAAFHKPEPTPRFEVSAGAFYSSRSLEFIAEDPATEFPGTPSKGLSLHAAFFPWPSKKVDGPLSGFGFSIGVYKSLGSTVTSEESDSVVDYSIDQNGYDFAAHYRLPVSNLINFDFQAFYAQDNYIIDGASGEFDVPDVSYKSIGVGAALELNITEHAQVGFGAKYFDVLDNGDISSMDWYGAGPTSGLALNANVTIPLPQKMFVRADLSYKRITLEPTGGGAYTDDMGVQSATDTTVAADVEVGVRF